MSFFKVTSWKDLLIHLVAMIGISVLLAYLILNIWLPSYTKHGEEIEVPVLDNLTVLEAQQTLEAKGLRLEIQDTAYNARFVPSGITRQEPKGKSFVKENRRVYVTVNSDHIPDIEITAEKLKNLQNISLAIVKSKIKNYGFTFNKPKYVPGKYPDYVNCTLFKGDTLKVGMKIPQGSKLDIRVQNGRL